MLDRQTIQQEIQASCQEERDDSLLKQFPTAYEEGIFYLDLKTDPDSKESPLELYNKPVKKMRLIVTADAARIDRLTDKEVCLYINYQDGTKLTKTVSKDKKNSLIALFKKLEAEPKIHFAQMNKGEAHQWRTLSVDEFDIYPRKTYSELHKKIIKATMVVAKKDKLSHLNLIDIGCGDGKLLRAMEQEADTTIKINLVGLDYNYKNIYDAKTNYQGDCHFLYGNSLHLDKVLANCFEKGIFNKNYPTFLSLSGSITRHVLDNGFEAVRILQKAALNHVDYLVGGGATIPLFNEFMAKRIGYKKIDLSELKDIPGSHFFLFRRLSLAEILDNKIKKIKNSNYLDLSLSPNPDEILKILDEQGFIKDNLTIDISFCELTDNLIKKLQELANNHKELKLVGWHWDISFLKALNEMRGIFRKIDTQFVTNECYLMAPRSFFLSLHDKELFTSPQQNFTKEEHEKHIDYLLKMDDIRVSELLPIEEACSKVGDRDAYQVACSLIQKQPSLVDSIRLSDQNFCKSLLDSKADISYVLKRYIGDYTHIIKLLEEDNINPNQFIDSEGNTLLHHMVNRVKNKEVIETFIEENPDFINRKNNAGQTPLHISVRSASRKEPGQIYHYLLNECKADFTVRDSEGATVLHYAAEREVPNVIEIIAKRDQDFIDQVDNQGRTVVHYALSEGNFEILPVLRQYGADFLALDKNGTSPLELVMKRSKDFDSTAKILTYYKNEFGTEVLNKRNASGKTLALIAMENLNAKTVIWLHENGADVSQIFDPVNIAKVNPNSPPAFIFLVDLFSKINPQYLYDESKAGISLVKLAISKFKASDTSGQYTYPLNLLLTTNVNLNMPDLHGNTAAHTLATNVNFDEKSVNALINRGLDLTVQNTQGDTPLHIAFKNNNLPVIESIIKLDWKLLLVVNRLREYPLQNATFCKKKAFCNFMADISSKIDPDSLLNNPHDGVKLTTMMTKFVEYLENIKVNRSNFLKLLNGMVSSLTRGLDPKVEMMMPLIKYLISKGAQLNDEIRQRINLSPLMHTYTVATVPQRSKLLSHSTFFTDGRHSVLQMKHIRIANSRASH